LAAGLGYPAFCFGLVSGVSGPPPGRSWPGAASPGDLLWADRRLPLPPSRPTGAAPLPRRRLPSPRADAGVSGSPPSAVDRSSSTGPRRRAGPSRFPGPSPVTGAKSILRKGESHLAGPETEGGLLFAELPDVHLGAPAVRSRNWLPRNWRFRLGNLGGTLTLSTAPPRGSCGNIPPTRRNGPGRPRPSP